MAELYNFPKDHSSELQYSIEVTDDEIDTISIDGVTPNSNITIYLDGLLLVKNVHYTINIGEIVLSNYKARKGSIFTIRLGSESVTDNTCIASSIPIKDDEKFGNASSVEGAIDHVATLAHNMIASKVNAEDNKGLSTNDFTNDYKNKLEGIESGANNYSHPTSSGNKHIPSGGSEGQILKWSSEGTAEWSGEGLSTNDFTNDYKNKLEGIESGANNYSHPTSSGNKHIPSGGSEGQILKWSSEGTAEWQDAGSTGGAGANSTDTSSKIYLVGATEQSETPETFSDDEIYVTNGTLSTKSLQLGNGAVTLQYDSTSKCISFVFN